MTTCGRGAALAHPQPLSPDDPGGSAQRVATEAHEPYAPGSQGHQPAFILGVVQPGPVGLMDGFSEEMEPLVAAAFATRNSSAPFLVRIAAAIGAGISMAFSEGLSDDGKLSSRSSSCVREPICGVMTFLGTAGHTLPLLIPTLLIPTLLTALVFATGVVVTELLLTSGSASAS